MRALLVGLVLGVVLVLAGCASATQRTYVRVSDPYYVIVGKELTASATAEIGWPTYRYKVLAGRYRAFLSDERGTYYYRVGAKDDGVLPEESGLYLLRDGSGGGTYFWPRGPLMFVAGGGTVSLGGAPDHCPIPLGAFEEDDLKQIVVEAKAP